MSLHRLTLKILQVSLLLLTGSGLALAQAPPAQVPNEEQILQARDKAMAYLLSSMGEAPLGYQAFAAMAMMKAETGADIPEIKVVIDKILAQFSEKGFKPLDDEHYTSCVILITLANFDREKYKPQIEMVAEHLIREQESNGAWTYGMSRADRGKGDVSLTQFVVLALWEAARSGVTVPMKTWDKCAEWLCRVQLSDGGFCYHPSSADTPSDVKHSITAAGVSSLLVIRLHLYPQSRMIFSPTGEPLPLAGKKFGVLENTTPGVAEYNPKTSHGEIDRAIGQGIRWLNSHFTLSQPKGWKIYYLYAIERVAAIAGMKQLGTHDWYNEGAQILLASQTPTGTWVDGGAGEEKHLLTGAGFAIMFLSKATAKIIDAQFGTGLLIGGRGLPDNLKDLQNNNGNVQVRKSKGSFDDLLAELEKPGSAKVEAVQSAIIDKVLTERPTELIKQKDRMKKLASDPRAEVRLTAMWALGRTSDLRVAPVLIRGLRDPSEEVALEARNSLRILSRNLRGLKRDIEDKFDPQQEYKVWTEWYRSIRPYDERDDLIRE